MIEKTVRIETDDKELYDLISLFLRDGGFSVVTDTDAMLTVIDEEMADHSKISYDKVLFISDSGRRNSIFRPFTRAGFLSAVRSVIGDSAAKKDDFRFAESVRRIYSGKLYASFTEKEFEILKLLFNSGGEVVTRAEIAEIACREASIELGKTTAVDVFICGIRKKLASVFGDGMIKTVRGRGYSFNLTN